MNTTIEVGVDQGLATLVMSRPERKNALTAQMFAELLEALAALRRDPTVKALLLTGAGSDFCSGGDLGSMQGAVEADAIRQRMVDNNRLLSALADFDRPVVAAVDGVAFGAGFSLALAADFVIASQRARFCMAFARVGLAPDLGASYFLPRIVGLQKAKQLVYSAAEIGAEQALALGIALEVQPAELLHSRAEELARGMANMSGCAFGMTKRLLGRSFESDLATQLDAEASSQAVAMSSSYLQQATARFASKQPPLYRWPLAQPGNR
ncbi:enoyl-CoA hydratase/isomerase family protein [Pseudomonas sp. JQ170]|jgi:enoyl-CoA hydratase/carnithine racemase|uniref:enoyl-CoA hydratase/isomerase family protein n=1 Tax=unclassified Pseudomonas TaxID=196821 RepID=UPI000FBB7961|nr:MULTISPECIES: enoyl-CoA hydratase/isomerase family protein [unclassified Pseudomonas]MDN7143969.1 enoyl-CoA hydratase/isomerase family protein [Pseudomonas sp. JQ170]WRO78395.1 enoyl-CoA hydratase/isomerase family protein [Pseudomonas sp. 170C]